MCTIDDLKEGDSLCQECFNFGCSWHKEFKPVDGWEAEPTTKSDGSKVIESYRVTRCPEFQLRHADEWKRVRVREIAEITGVSIRTVFRDIEAGRVRQYLMEYGYDYKSVREGKYYRYYVKEIGGLHE